MIMLNTKFQAWKDRDALARGHPFNPLNKVRLGFHEAKDSRAVAEMIINPNNEKEKDRLDRLALNLMIGAILHIKYSGKDKTINGLRKFLSRPRKNVLKIIDAMLTTKHDHRGFLNWIDPITGRQTKTHPIIASIARDFKRKYSDELSNIIDVAIIKLKVWPGSASCCEILKVIKHG